jgi:hypothetical protein
MHATRQIHENIETTRQLRAERSARDAYLVNSRERSERRLDLDPGCPK